MSSGNAMNNYLLVGQEAIGEPYALEISADSAGELIYDINNMAFRYGPDSANLNLVIYQPIVLIDKDNNKVHPFRYVEEQVTYNVGDSYGTTTLEDAVTFGLSEAEDISEFAIVRRPFQYDDGPDGPVNQDKDQWRMLSASNFTNAVSTVTTDSAVLLARPLFLYSASENTLKRVTRSEDGWSLTSDIGKLHSTSF